MKEIYYFVKILCILYLVIIILKNRIQFSFGYTAEKIYIILTSLYEIFSFLSKMLLKDAHACFYPYYSSTNIDRLVSTGYTYTPSKEELTTPR